MGIEIERKFLVVGDQWRQGADGVEYRQAYLSTDPRRSVRVRRCGDAGFLTCKGTSNRFSRLEFEYEIPARDADQMLVDLCLEGMIEKLRYRRSGPDGQMWEIDEFMGLNRGLVIAEIELTSENEPFVAPAWLGQEVSDDPRYFNSSLSVEPYSTWGRGESSR